MRNSNEMNILLAAGSLGSLGVALWGAFIKQNEGFFLGGLGAAFIFSLLGVFNTR